MERRLGTQRRSSSWVAQEKGIMTDDVQREPGILDRVRFRPELEMLEGIFQRFGLAERSGEETEKARRDEAREEDAFRANNVRLSSRTAPRLCGLFEEVCKTLELDQGFDLYVVPDARINASARWQAMPGRPQIHNRRLLGRERTR